MSPSLVAKLNPARFSGMSPKMAAIVGAILGEHYTDPALTALCVTSDGCALGMEAGDCGFNHFLGSAADLERNWTALLDAAGLTARERKLAERAFAQVVDHA